MSVRSNLVLGATLCALASTTLAQSTPPARPEAVKSEQVAAPRTPAVNPVGIARASDLLGQNVVDGADKTVGEVEDLISCGTGEVVVLIKRASDEQFIAAPLSALSARLDAKAGVVAANTAKVERLVVIADKGLAKAPLVLDRNKLDPAWWTAYSEAYGLKPMAPMALGPTCIEALIGQDVKSAAGDDIGDIEDVAIDLADSRIAYVVLSTGGTLGVGNTLHCVGFAALEPNAERKFCTLKADQASLARTAKVDIEKLPARPNLDLGAVAPSTSDRGEKSGNNPR